MVYSDPLYI